MESIKPRIKIGDNLQEAQFVERLNRFLCTVKLGRNILQVHLHDPGRLKELLFYGARVLLRQEDGAHRKTRYDIVGAYHDDILVSCDSRVPNRLIKKALLKKALLELPDYDRVIPEYSYRDSRIDFCLDTNILVEVKGATLVDNGLALFPDAPTKRGRKHLHTLTAALKEGFQCYVLFLIQRPDAYRFSPNAETDPEFAAALTRAAAGGVGILVYTSEFVVPYMYLRERLSLIEL